MPELSIITINFNNRDGLQETMQSVFGQSFTGYEYIIIDGGSTDGSKEIIQDNSGKLSHWVSEKDNGIYDAINKGIQKATGSYLMFLNSGDYFLTTEILQNSFAVIEKENLDVYYGDIEIEFADKQVCIQKHAPVLDLYFLEKRTLNHQASFIKAALFEEFGLYNPKYRMAADYAFYLSAFLAGKKFKYIDLVMIHYPWDGISSRNMDAYMRQMKEVWKELVPAHVDVMLNENKKLKNTMNRVIMRIAKKMDNAYQSTKTLFRKSL
ncbi:MAG: glycosyltransferase family 2 protein [Ginsengibacter sp.]